MSDEGKEELLDASALLLPPSDRAPAGEFETNVKDPGHVQDAMWIQKTFKREQKDVKKETKRLWFRGKVKAVIVFLGSGKN